MTGPIPADRRVATVKDLRKLRMRRLVLRLLIGVGLPTALASIYYSAMASPQYESVTSFTIQSADGAGGAGLELLFAAVPGNSAGRDTLLVQEHIRSRDMLAHLEAEENFSSHYQNADVDFVSRLSGDAAQEQRYDDYLDKVRVEHDTASGVLTLRVRAFSAEKAHAFSRAILEASEQVVNDLTERARRDRIALAESEVERAETRLGNARRAIVELQGQGAELDPTSSAQAILGVRTAIESELVAARAELNTLRASLQPTAPRLVAQRQHVASLQGQLERQRRRLASDDTEGLHTTIAEFEPAVVEKEFAERAYESAVTSLEVSRIEASRQHRYLATIAGPSQPDDSTYPKIFSSILTVFVLSFALLGIGTLLIASIREHANV